MTNKLIEGLRLMDIDPSDAALAKLELYINELELWNNRLNLVSFDDREQLVVRHILDSLSGLKAISGLEGNSIADIGSGAGLPGLLLAIFMEDRHFTLVERSGKKAGFLRSTAALLGLVDRVNVFDSDLKQVSGQYDIVCLRAFRDFGEFYKELRAVTAESGVIAAYKGRMSSITSDLYTAGINPRQAEIIPLTVPFLDEERNLLLVR